MAITVVLYKTEIKFHHIFSFNAPIRKHWQEGGFMKKTAKQICTSMQWDLFSLYRQNKAQAETIKTLQAQPNQQNLQRRDAELSSKSGELKALELELRQKEMDLEAKTAETAALKAKYEEAIASKAAYDAKRKELEKEKMDLRKARDADFESVEREKAEIEQIQNQHRRVRDEYAALKKQLEDSPHHKLLERVVQMNHMPLEELDYHNTCKEILYSVVKLISEPNERDPIPAQYLRPPKISLMREPGYQMDPDGDYEIVNKQRFPNSETIRTSHLGLKIGEILRIEARNDMPRILQEAHGYNAD
jgi:hypothetical protein